MMWKILLLSLVSCVSASHFRGAMVQWRPVNPANFDGLVRTFMEKKFHLVSAMLVSKFNFSTYMFYNDN